MRPVFKQKKWTKLNISIKKVNAGTTAKKYKRIKQRRKAFRNKMNKFDNDSITTTTATNSCGNTNNNHQQVAHNERKSLRVLIIMFTIFIALWCPFFVLNTFSALYEDFVKALLSKHESLVYFVLTWLGYFSSMLNPLVYTMFNKNFRLAFIQILKCRSS